MLARERFITTLFGTKEWRQIRCRTREKINGYGENGGTDTGFGLASTWTPLPRAQMLRVQIFIFLSKVGLKEFFFFFFLPLRRWYVRRLPLSASAFSLEYQGVPRRRTFVTSPREPETFG